MLATSIVSRSFRGLLHPLDYGQLAPVPFLWLERAAVAVGGPDRAGAPRRSLPRLVRAPARLGSLRPPDPVRARDVRGARLRRHLDQPAALRRRAQAVRPRCPGHAAAGLVRASGRPRAGTPRGLDDARRAGRRRRAGIHPRGIRLRGDRDRAGRGVPEPRPGRPGGRGGRHRRRRLSGGGRGLLGVVSRRRGQPVHAGLLAGGNASAGDARSAVADVGGAARRP